mmetsp:Transcript_38103/g.88675  ORF Transcript_38103/g.88675 Transcript_38103/m.88675 type:complete len:257 (+) Transcript_38103:205-975(+)
MKKCPHLLIHQTCSELFYRCISRHSVQNPFDGFSPGPQPVPQIHPLRFSKFSYHRPFHHHPFFDLVHLGVHQPTPDGADDPRLHLVLSDPQGLGHAGVRQTPARFVSGYGGGRLGRERAQRKQPHVSLSLLHVDPVGFEHGRRGGLRREGAVVVEGSRGINVKETEEGRGVRVRDEVADGGEGEEGDAVVGRGAGQQLSDGIGESAEDGFGGSLAGFGRSFGEGGEVFQEEVLSVRGAAGFREGVGGGEVKGPSLG